MPLSMAEHITFSHPCPFCGHEIRRKGRWFQTVICYKCMSCRRLVRLAYADKAQLLASHSDVSASAAASERTGRRAPRVLGLSFRREMTHVARSWCPPSDRAPASPPSTAELNALVMAVAGRLEGAQTNS
jgi:hypothetical protein